MAFSASWLALREPVDKAARDGNLMQKAVALAGDTPTVLDLGSGTGSTVRAFGSLLPTSTNWTLVDIDSELLAVAGQMIPTASLHKADLGEVNQLPVEGVDLVTGSALLDLVTEQWLKEISHRFEVPCYFALTYDGRMLWEPAASEDEQITKSFNLHQQQDKGMGEALGPRAIEVAVSVFEQAGFEVFVADSDWELTSADSDLHLELLRGIASAASKMGNLASEQWLQDKLQKIDSLGCTIGHKDILAIPSNSISGGEK